MNYRVTIQYSGFVRKEITITGDKLAFAQEGQNILGYTILSIISEATGENVTVKLSWSKWTKETSDLILSIGGVSGHDLGDYSYHDAYESGMTPMECAKEVLRDNGWVFEAGFDDSAER